MFYLFILFHSNNILNVLLGIFPTEYLNYCEYRLALIDLSDKEYKFMIDFTSFLSRYYSFDDLFEMYQECYYMQNYNVNTDTIRDEYCVIIAFLKKMTDIGINNLEWSLIDRYSPYIDLWFLRDGIVQAHTVAFAIYDRSNKEQRYDEVGDEF
ncbi:hypothetical protein EDI_238800 [Entamoeba dispar SAW760]|uniref:Uncharacterized protein n=1 Tax=Entamoeba dispar (strain ATCC PRA-260 / SAW760) TaxID=370354 RepID=B0EHJ3_ENTDS|nr:uncharacterized protein EDI_238800 [Entamoeba dispar SAW760]EDR25991.1 hypothetical protein EDI_238800 [Entamoeba dispar SAW760]|eukprot:EDR25991.1 hypothetical protein EDI_238800 [Entamoeba dispar SAW760]